MKTILISFGIPIGILSLIGVMLLVVDERSTANIIAAVSLISAGVLMGFIFYFHSDKSEFCQDKIIKNKVVENNVEPNLWYRDAEEDI
ncbi:hypothetical protein A2645_00705 [Candidatus Nomurabacteria bacterium RIFCSPHIGHO2_01_FULL_39_9]|uniref:Uncharacterized protein n=1 Tax=Candidatus Nomurabacteria bacterium RIFCSPHIGHO2_01_FULL_39_9 TaxID=1801735 RepID=A0A1F6UXK3_9BACT|nr:MAG: hypothetical protein A2645_00705 [Candidatus Nomurabacteria bacterium RIFCSPHIGHO2_01_FULL_39_9]